MTKPSLDILLALALLSAAALARGHDEFATTKVEAPLVGLEELTFLKTGDPLVDWSSRRVWTAADGRTLRARLVSAGDEGVVLRPEGGTDAALPLERLSEEDRRFVREWRAVSRYFQLGHEPTRNLAGTIEAGLFDGAFAKEGKVHETRHFRFECDASLSQEVVKDFSRLFEATYLAVESLPLALAIDEPTGGKFLVRLFASARDYYAAGGSPDAAGVYLIPDRVMLVPLESLGLTPGSGGYRKTRDFDPRTLVHETTHALTHQWLAHAPMWFVEGLAEYVSAIPYANGRFDLNRHREGLAELAAKKFGGDARRYPLAAPADFARLGQAAFMGAAEAPEAAVELPRVEPFQISLVARGAGGAEEAPTAEGERQPDSEGGAGKADGGIEPPSGGGRPAMPDGREVVVRYVSSMLLLHHLVESGQTEALRRYLFDFLRFEWDRSRYLSGFEAEFRRHRAEVEGQIAAFEAELKSFNEAATAYNEAVRRRKGGDTGGELPERPEPPTPPAALPVPEALAIPRPPASLSRRAFLEEALGRHLEVPEKLSLDPLK
jgi:hypothetical protein